MQILNYGGYIRYKNYSNFFAQDLNTLSVMPSKARLADVTDLSSLGSICIGVFVVILVEFRVGLCLG